MKIKDVKAFVGKCPALDPDAIIYTDFTNSSPISYGVQDHGAAVLSRNILGKRTMRHSYILDMRLSAITDANRTKNSEERQGFQQWLVEQSDKKNFPSAGENERIVKMEATNPMPMGYDSGTNTGLYSIQFFIIYEEM